MNSVECWELQLHRRRLLRGGEPVVLGSRAFDLLVALWERRVRVVGKDELMESVWPELVVEENNLQVQISHLRKVLGADAIATVPGRGYRLTVELEAVPAPASPFALATPPAAPAQGRLTPLRGRDGDLSTLIGMVEAHPLVTLVGPGGMGKTLLARHVVAAWLAKPERGACWVDLGGCAGPGAVASALAAALGASRRESVGAPTTGRAAFAGGERLQVLDNAEHLLAEVAAVAGDLQAADPGLRLLVTSQAPLLLAPEQVYRLEPLAVPEGALPAAQALAFPAVALFVERARSADAHFVLTDDLAEAVVALCRRLDGVPLALELAAARAPFLGVPHSGDLFQDRLFEWLNSSRDRSAPPRQRTLHAALDWSHALLEEREKAVLRRLSVFVGSAPLGELQQVVSDAGGPLDRWAAMDALGILVDRSLVMRVAPASGGVPCFRLLHAVRAYALERLAQAGEAEAVRRRHALVVAERLAAVIARSASLRRVSHASPDDLDDARDALSWARSAGETELAQRIQAGLNRVTAGSHREWLDSLRHRVDAPEPGNVQPPWE